MSDLIVPGPKHLEDLVGVTQIGLGLDELDAKIRKDLALSLEYRRRTWIDRQAAQIATPGDTSAAKIALEGTGEA